MKLFNLFVNSIIKTEKMSSLFIHILEIVYIDNKDILDR